MKLVLALLFTVSAWAQVAQPVSYVSVDPAGACTNGTRMRYNFTNNKLWGCTNLLWTVQPTGGGGGSAFTGSTAVSSTFSATPTFSLADISIKSPILFQPAVMTANVTSVLFTNLTPGAVFYIQWIQAASGGPFTVTYGGSISSFWPACQISSTAGARTIQRFIVESDGATVDAIGCITSTTTSVFAGPVQIVGQTVASLPTCNAGANGTRASVTDSNAASFTAAIGAVVAGGGSTSVPVFCDGSNWRVG